VTPERATPSALTWQVTRVVETGSTNADLLAAARGGAPFGSVLVAEYQTSGRGRLGRRWEAPPGSSLLVSLLLPPELASDHPQRLTQAVALAAAEACERVAGVQPSLKWPNDLLVGERKLAGILAESLVTGGTVAAIVVGLGLNVNWPPDVPDDLADRVTALNHEAGHDVDRLALLDTLLAALADTDWVTLADAYRARLATLGADVRVDLGSSQLIGRAEDVTETGELVVVASDGQRHVVTAGDVVHLRLA
jgi:BirA family biotin operon repressor/biotin-[acetyl-CoA-carboxylase] ligase